MTHWQFMRNVWRVMTGKPVLPRPRVLEDLSKDGPTHPEPEYYRICEVCGKREAALFCRTHCAYVCLLCVEHGQTSLDCQFMSMAAVNALSASLTGQRGL